MTLLSEVERQKVDQRDDDAFYDAPRFVTHADDAFLDRLTALYDEHTAPGDRVFDAMGSWVSHLPDTSFERVIGHGLNETELAENDRYDEWFCQNLNETQELPLADDSVDVVCCALSVQYLQFPAAVFEEFARVLDEGGHLIVSFSNRMFPTKAVHAWRQASMDERSELVAAYARAGDLSVVDRIAESGAGDPFFAVVARAT